MVPPGPSAPSRFGDHRRIAVGLLGGSFNPAHEGHHRLALRALHALRLDQVWLLVSPGNPLKARAPMAPVGDRLASARHLADGRRILATDIERHLGTRYTCDTLAALKRRFPAVRFVWLMGADSLRDLPHWRGWQRIARLVPFAVFPRPSYNHAALSGRAAHRFGPWRLPAREAARLASAEPPAWIYLTGRETSISATALRAAGASIEPRTGADNEPDHRLRGTVIARKPAGEGERAPRRAAPLPASTGAEIAKAAPTPRKKAAAAGPKPAATTARAPAEPSVLERAVAVITTSLADDKAEDIVVLDLAGRAAFADRMIIATGLADRQITAMATHLEEQIGKAGLGRVQVEGAGGSDWVLIDVGDVIVHLFKPEARTLYGLERMWGADLDEAQLDGSQAGTVRL